MIMPEYFLFMFGTVNFGKMNLRPSIDYALQLALINDYA
jgi:hypothetical protein